MMGFFASTGAGLVGLFIFILFYIAMIAWLLRPGAKGKYKKDAEIPFKEMNDE